MKRNKQNPDFVHIGRKLLKWYDSNARALPWRNTKQPYNIWISEIILQQTQVKRGLNHYLNFVERFPDVQALAAAETDEVLLYWKGMGYYSRALNLHKAAKQVVEDFNGNFPEKYEDILKLKGIGKYTAAAISSICFDEKIPAVDGNFYRVVSRLFVDDFDISQSSAFKYFSELSMMMMPEYKPGDFNQAVMDLGSEICRPKKPDCGSCPLNENCIAFQSGTVHKFPVKLKRAKTTDLFLKYYFVHHKNKFLLKQRADDFIWKKLYEFPVEVPVEFEQFVENSTVVKHKLTHKNLTIQIETVSLKDELEFISLTKRNHFNVVDFSESKKKSFPKPLENFIDKWIQRPTEIK